MSYIDDKVLLDPYEELLSLNMDVSFSRILKSASGFYIGGYASPVLIDKKTGEERADLQGESIDLNGLEEAFHRMMKEPSRRNLMGHHTNVQIGEILPSHTDSDGMKWDSGVIRLASKQYPKKGLFIVAKLFEDIKESLRYIRDMKFGHRLSLSIGGEAIERKTICEDKTCRSVITVMDLYETSSCEKGVNPEARAFILKSTKSDQSLANVDDGASLLKALREGTLRKTNG
jgi:hypothetical protein